MENQIEKLVHLSRQNLTLKEKICAYESMRTSQNKSTQCRNIERLRNSAFLERTLTFKSLIGSSTVHELSNESFQHFDQIRSFILKLSQDTNELFGKSVTEFNHCVQNSKESNPNVIMSNTRQFMNGIKNYLVKNDDLHPELNYLIDNERAKLKSGECLNIDSLIEDCLQFIVLKPLKPTINYLLVDWLIGDGSIVALSKNIKKINSLDEIKCVEYLAMSKLDHRPNLNALRVIRVYYNRMQAQYSPLVKLKYVLFIINELSDIFT